MITGVGSPCVGGQVIVVPANPKALDYAADTVAMLKAGGVRAEADLRDDMGVKDLRS